MEAYPYKEIARGRVGRYEVELGELSTDSGPSPYSIIHMRPFACCVAFFEGRLAMVRQFRYSVSSWQLELPAGGIEEGEQPSAAAVRELREETGLVAREVFDLGMVYCSVGSLVGSSWVGFLPASTCVVSMTLPASSFHVMVNRSAFLKVAV